MRLLSDIMPVVDCDESAKSGRVVLSLSCSCATNRQTAARTDPWLAIPYSTVQAFRQAFARRSCADDLQTPNRRDQEGLAATEVMLVFGSPINKVNKRQHRFALSLQ